MPKAFNHLFKPPTMGGNKKAANKAYMTGNAAPKNFKPSGKMKK